MGRVKAGLGRVGQGWVGQGPGEAWATDAEKYDASRRWKDNRIEPYTLGSELGLGRAFGK